MGPKCGSSICPSRVRSNCEKAWFGWPCDEAIEKLRAEFTMIPDLEGRKANARAIQQRALETVPYVPVGQFYLVRGYRKDLTGLLSAGIPVYWNVGRGR